MYAINTRHPYGSIRWTAAYLLLATFALVLAACGGEAGSGGAALLDIAALSTEAKAYSGFNQTVEQAVEEGQQWPMDPLMVARRFSGWQAEHAGAWLIEGTGETPSLYQVIGIADGLADDSVRGERLALRVEQAADGSWRIGDAQLSRRCWPNRGHDWFSADPCQ